jgi:hypothetical protein
VVSVASRLDGDDVEELLGLVIITIVFSPAIAIGYGIGVVRTKRKVKADPSVALEAVRLDGVVDEIKHVAYEHMTLGDGGLAPIIVDIIRESDRKRDKNLILASETAAAAPQAKAPFIQLTSSPVPQSQPRYPAPQHAQPAPMQFDVPQAPVSPPVAPPVSPPVAPPPAQPYPAPQPSQHYPFQ